MLNESRDFTKGQIINILLDTNRTGMERLIDHMVKEGFFDAPCSGAYHLCEDGGLAEHSLNVYNVAVVLASIWFKDMEHTSEFIDSIAIAAILHDLGKMGDHHKANYTPNYVRSKTKNKETGEYDMVISAAKPYETNKELNYEEHEIRSVIIAERFIELTEDEETAILHHNGLYGKLDSSFGSYYDKHLLSFIIHTADMYCSRFLEVE